MDDQREGGMVFWVEEVEAVQFVDQLVEVQADVLQIP
jgi:hypothetical protein